MISPARGLVLNIQPFSVHDGRGIRTLVFLKGCPLRCRWCSNPESQSFLPELGFDPGACLGSKACGRCAAVCPSGAVRVEEGDLVFDRGICEGCLKCAAACPAGARRIYGELMSVDKVLDKVERDAVFHGRSGGGLTLSGGEAGAQPAFSLALLSEARRRHLDTTLETCGHYPFETLAALAGRLDRIIFDLKHWDGDRHREVTGGDLALIAGNLGRLAYEFPDKPLTVRTPVVPGLNDTEEDLREIRRLIPERADIEWELLAYHRLGESKYAFLGREPSWAGAPPDPGRLAALRRAVLGPAASL